MQTPNIKTKKHIIPRIYAYRTPSNTEKQGWFKIGYTDGDVDLRIKQQTHTVGITAEKIWDAYARYNVGEGESFTDHDFHAYLTRKGVPRDKGTEWFDFEDDVSKSKRMRNAFIMREDLEELDETILGQSYVLRNEQKHAVDMTFQYFNEHDSGEILWNAKPRFGKTLSAYDLVKKLAFHNVLILTNRPAVGNSWVDDYEKFIKYDKDITYHFVSDSPAIKDRNILSRKDYQNRYLGGNFDFENEPHQIAFVSLQDLKGSVYFGGDIKKLDWIKELNWDLVIIDESHEAVETNKTQFALDNIKHNYILHLSGTPFKQIAHGKFEDNQIFNWSYMDEQEAKENWDEVLTDIHNPYIELPTLNMYTYQMSNMIVDQIKQGADLDEKTNIDYAFDLNEFFSTDESGNFVYKDDILKWLDTLTENEKYPFSTPELRNELKHTLWMLDRVDSVRALAKLLKKHEVFKSYKTISVAGDGKTEKFNGQEFEQDEESIDGRNNALSRVKEKIKDNDKTITLTVGQLTTGVTVPEWTGVLMLSNVQSPALYMQAAFRSQNPHSWTEVGEDKNFITYRKKNAYLFDFDPERSLGIIDDFANNLNSGTSNGSGTSAEREENIKRLLNFFPVIGEDADGKMVELDAKQVLAIPRSIKTREVVRRGFMSNLLFNNISAIFRSKKILDIISKFPKTEEGKIVQAKNRIKQKDIDSVQVDDKGNVTVDEEDIEKKKESIFGRKVFDIQEVKKVVEPEDIDGSRESDISEKVSSILMAKIKPDFVKMREEYGLTHRQREQKEAQAQDAVNKAAEDFNRKLKVQQADFKRQLEENIETVKTVETAEDLVKQEKLIKEKNNEFVQTAYDTLIEELGNIVEETTRKVIQEQEKKNEEKKKNTVEDAVRANLRGFARAIPSFIMAYGNEDLTLATFDEYVSNEVFFEVTGITLQEFKFLRDGGSYLDDDGVEQHFEGGLFNEGIFDGSIKEFLRKKSELANYFEDNEESIYSYIPPQNTNQIYTPEWVVQKMVQQLEDENEGIYDDSSKTFIDLYMKSGLYITEIVKRLFNSDVIKGEFPDDYRRLKHILENQVYGLAPTEIIFRIALTFIFSDPTEGISRKNFVHLDAYPYAEAGTLDEKLDEAFE